MGKKVLDFRSDTVTRPTPGMLDAMMNAALGDDVFGDDPTVNALEAKAARLFGKDAALFCPSGTMTNQIAIKVHTKPGDEVICDRLAHIYNYEGGGIAFNSGCSVRLLDGDRGRFSVNQVQANINADDPHFPVTTLVSIENTCNKGGGSIWDRGQIAAIRAFCNAHDLKLHLDGARLFNALVETGEDTRSVGEQFHSISICLSKGLGCPVGSLLIGDASFIKQARRVRKVFGGGMRQAGILAAAGIYALDNNVHRLADDHVTAQELRKMLEKQMWVNSCLDVATNIVVVELVEGVDQVKILEQLREQGILAVGFGAGRLRFVSHLDIQEEDLNLCETAFSAIK
ncbi:MAG: GntG family PLP-dependent aldolase [Flavobacteriales bacterium]